MKNVYSFILGHSAKLSQAEIENVLKLKNINFEILEIAPKFLILETKINLDLDNLIQTLGGIIKIGKLEFFIDQLSNLDNLKNTLIKILQKNCNLNKKIKFGFSIYHPEKKLEKFIYKLAINLKKTLKDENVSSRIVTARQKDLSSVIVHKEHLIKLGFDIQVLFFNNRYYFFRSLVVQDFERFNILDYGRPRSDAHSGMMPPKLAKIMLNLVNKREIILDPFCGSGTIILMAAELNFKKILASDISEKAILDSEENLKWYVERFNKKVDAYIFKSNVNNLITEGIEENSIFSIVTEGYLGKPLRGNESLKFIQKQIIDLEKLYLESFVMFYRVLKNKGCVIISLPIFILNKQEYNLNIIEKIKKIGFKIENLLSESQGLVYKREKQKVHRKILKFIKI